MDYKRMWEDAMRYILLQVELSEPEKERIMSLGYVYQDAEEIEEGAEIDEFPAKDVLFYMLKIHERELEEYYKMNPQEEGPKLR